MKDVQFLMEKRLDVQQIGILKEQNHQSNPNIAQLHYQNTKQAPKNKQRVTLDNPDDKKEASCMSNLFKPSHNFRQ